MQTHMLLGVWLLILGLAGGCSGPKLVPAKGKIVSGGQPLKMGPQGVLQIILVPDEGAKAGEFTTYPADVDKEAGTFEVGGGVPPGKYRIAVLWLDPYPMKDKLNGKFTFEKTPLLRDVTGEGLLEIDLANPTGS